MEPRARAGRNLGKMNFTHNELAQLLYAHGDVNPPLSESVRVLDEIATDFIQSISLDAVRTANYAGRQKVKFDDFVFSMRRNPRFMGRIQEVFEKKKEIDAARKNFNMDEAQLTRDADREEKTTTTTTGGAKSTSSRSKQIEKQEEALGEADDDSDADADIGAPLRKT